MPQQSPLFARKELPIKLKRLTEDEVDEIAIQSFGNLYYYYPDQIKHLLRLAQARLEGKNR